MPTYKGRVWKFGDNISTDLLMPAFSLIGQVSPEDRPKYCMHATRPEFAEQVKPGDIVVAGRNFGCGSSRPAADNLKALGVDCLIAESIGAIFLRNAVNLGLPLLTGEGVSAAFEDGDEAEVNPRTGEVKNLRTGQSLKLRPIPDVLWDIVEAGGLMGLLEKERKGAR